MLNKKGYTIPMALALMLLLFAFAGSLLLVASYQYQNTYVRQHQNQLYLYATEVVGEATKSIEKGELNQEIAQTVENLVGIDSAKLSNYAKSYKFQFDLGEDLAGNSNYLNNDFVQNDYGKIYIEMLVRYEPQGPGQVLPGAATDYIRIGDRMYVEYRIKQGNMEYRISADYYCSSDKNKNPDGSDIAAPVDYVNMKWQLNHYMGKLYTI